MPRRTDIHSILIIGSGPIVIGQGCEFDYSGVQACRALREEGYRIVLINSNPATIMTDPEFADATYIEPITPEAVEKILKLEKDKGTPVDALLPTLGGQTGLNVGMACFDKGILQKYGVQMIGAQREAIFRGEDRQAFKDLMIQIGLKVPKSSVVHTLDAARKVMDDIGLPAIIRPAFTLGGTGGGIAYNVEEYETIVQRGIDASPVNEVLIEQSVIGWKEYELEVVRDRNDNCIVVCGIENIDAMGVHTGDSITVAPIQTLTDKEYQRMRDAAFAVIRAVGVETGGSNIQFGINPANGDMVVIEMNPRVSRSSALASKATGYPIAKIAAKLAVGYTLDELPNPITTRKRHPAELSDGATALSDVTAISPGGATSSSRGAPSSSRDETSSARGASSSARGATSSAHGATSSARGATSSARDATSSARDETSSARGATSSSSGGTATPGESGALSGGTGAGGRDVREDYELYTSACFEPTIDYVVIKIPRWTFEKFPDADETLTTQMKSVGEAMAIGRTFKEALQKGIRSMEVKRFGFGLDKNDKWLAAEQGRGEKGEGRGREAQYPIPDDKLRRKLAVPSQGRFYYIRYALKMGWTIDQIHELTKIDPWFLAQFKELVEFEEEAMRPVGHDELEAAGLAGDPHGMVRAKQLGYSDVQLASISDASAAEMRQARQWIGVKPVYKLVDTCAAEFEAATPYYYSTYESPITVDGKAFVEDEIRLTDRPKVIIIGGGPNRIGQGIEFDYCCVQAAFACRELGLESVMINSNPETVSTDYDTSDLLFFEPLTHEDVLNICERLNGTPFKDGADGGSNAHGKPSVGLVQGVVVQFGGQTPLNLARGLHEAGVPLLGTPIDSLDRAGDRELFRDLLQKLGLKQPANGIARNVEDAKRIANEIGYPVLVRPSFVLGGRAMEIVSDEQQLDFYMRQAMGASTLTDTPILVDKFLDNATECDVDCIADYDAAASPGAEIIDDPEHGGQIEVPADFMQNAAALFESVQTFKDPSTADSEKFDRAFAAVAGSIDKMRAVEPKGNAIVIGVMQHIEEAGIHSGDSACVLPPHTFTPELVAELKRQTKLLAKELRVRGLMNVQYAVKDGEIYVIEVNPRASRTVPFVGKATGVPWAKIAAKVMMGKSLAELGYTQDLPDPQHVSVKEVVFPFSKFPGVDIILGPEMRSTGEVMGLDTSFELAFAKSQLAAGTNLPTKGTVYISVRDDDKADAVKVAKILADCGFDLIATGGTFTALQQAGIKARRINKIAEGRPNVVDEIKNGRVQLMINTPTKKGPATDEGKIRALAVTNKLPIFTTMTAAEATAKAIAALQKGDWGVRPLQEYHAAYAKR